MKTLKLAWETFGFVAAELMTTYIEIWVMMMDPALRILERLFN